MNYAILKSGESDADHWNKCTKENQVCVCVTRYRAYADVWYDTFSRKPGDRDRLTEEGINRLCKAFVAHDNRALRRCIR